MTLGHEDDGIKFSDLYMFNRFLSGDSAQTTITAIAYQNGKEVGGARQLLDQVRLRVMHDALTEVEQILADPEQTIDWDSRG